MNVHFLRLLGALTAASALAASTANAQSVAEFYKGKTMTLISSSAPGGGYDTLSRIIANHLGKHLAGSPTVVVKNMAGAGGIVATNFLFSVAAKDGTVIGGVQNNTPFEPLFGAKGPTYDPLKFIWLGTPSIEVAISTVWHTAPVSTWQEAQKTEFTMASSGVNSTPSFYGRLLTETLGFKQKIVVGYQSQTHAFLAMERGEVDGYPSVFYNSLVATRPSWIPEKKVKLLVQMGLEKEPHLPDVPFALDLLTNEDDKLLSIAAYAPLQSGRPYLMPPGVPGDRAEAMQRAMMATFKDPAFIAEANKRGMDVGSPRTGEELRNLLVEVYTKTPDHIVQRLRKISTP